MTDPLGSESPEPDPQTSSHPTGPIQEGGSGLPENVAGALAYLLGPITGVAFFVIDRDRPFVRFHAIQCIGLTVAWVAIWVVLMVAGVVLNFIPILGAIATFLLTVGVSLAGFGLWLWLMYQAYSGAEWAIPGLEPHVRRIAAESAGTSQN